MLDYISVCAIIVLCTFVALLIAASLESVDVEPRSPPPAIARDVDDIKQMSETGVYRLIDRARDDNRYCRPPDVDP